MRAREALGLARACRQQAQITTNVETAAVLSDLAARYEAIASQLSAQSRAMSDKQT